MKSLVPVLLLILVVGCGGDDDSSESSPETTSAATDTEAGADGPSDAENPGTTGAVLTIGTETLEFDSIDRCVTIGGQVSGGAESTNGEVQLSFTIPPEDWETNENFRNPPSVSVIDRGTEPEIRWSAGATGGQVDSFSIDGESAAGEATFVSESITFSEGFVSETVSGTFDISCGG